MASYIQPTIVPRWNDSGANNLEPPEAKKDLGWEFGESPPSTWENWRTKLVGEWLKWIDERFDDGADENELVIRDPSDLSSAIRITGNRVLVDHPLQTELGGGQLVLGAQTIDTLFVDPTQVTVDGTLVVEDPSYVLAFSAGKPTIVVGSNEWIDFNRSTLRYTFNILGSEVFGIGSSGAEFGDPNFYLSFNPGPPATAAIVFDLNDVFYFDRSVDVFRWETASATIAALDSSGFYINGSTLSVDDNGTGGLLNFGGGASSIAGGTGTFTFTTGSGMQFTAASAINFDGASFNFDFGAGEVQFSGNTAAFIYSGLTKMLLNMGSGSGPASLSMALADSSLGTSTLDIDHAFLGRTYGRYDAEDPGPGNGRAAAHAGRNAVLAQTSWRPNGTAVNPSGSEWNVSGVTRTGVGAYRVDLYRDINEDANIIATLSWHSGVAFPGSDQYHVFARLVNFGQINVETFSKASNNVLTNADFPNGIQVNLTVIGRPFNFTIS